MLAGCGYTPPGGTDTKADKYRTDLAACEASVPDAVDKRNAKTGLAWMTGGITRWSQIGDGKGACMAGKGWGLTRTCTAEELRTGGGNRTVGPSGIRCADPAKG